MTAQGWQPGQYLGAKNAIHAEFHTAANASHIRVAIKDDNLGLGAKIGSGVGHGECTGLDAFKNILGRLNGKDEDELAKEQKSREDLKRAIYTERRWGSIRFVKGGFLIGDKIQHLIDGEAERIGKLAKGNRVSSASNSRDSSSEEEALAVVVKEPKKSTKKRKLEDMEHAGPKVVAVKVKKSKKKRKSEAGPDDKEEVAAALQDVKLSKKKSKKDHEPKVDAEDTAEDAEFKKRKKEKQDRKEKKEKWKSPPEEESTKQHKKKAKQDKHEVNLEDTPESSEPMSRPANKENTPLVTESSGRSTPMMQGRHAVRSRNIAQKRLASMDVTALNQVSHIFH